MYFYSDKLLEADIYPYFSYGYRIGHGLCPRCQANALVSGKGETIKCLNCGIHIPVSENVKQQKIYGEILLADAEEQILKEDYKRALTRLRKAEKVFKKLTEIGDQKSFEIYFEVMDLMAFCYDWMDDERSLKVQEKAISLLKELLQKEETDVFLARLSDSYRKASSYSYASDRLDLVELYQDYSVEAMRQAYNLASAQNRKVLEGALIGLLEDLGKEMERSAQHADNGTAVLIWPKALHFYKPLLSFLKDKEADSPREKISINKKIARLSDKIREIQEKIPNKLDENSKTFSRLTVLSSKPEKTAKKTHSGTPVLPSKNKTSQNPELPQSQKKNLVAGLIEQYLDLAKEQIFQKQENKASITIEQCVNFLDSPVFQDDAQPEFSKTRQYIHVLKECAGLLESINQKEKALALYQKISFCLESSQDREFLPVKAQSAFKLALHGQSRSRKEERKSWQKALELSQKLLKEAKDQKEKLGALKQLYVINTHLAASSLKDNQFKKAMHQYKDALSKAEQILQIEPGEENLQLCLQTVNEIAKAYENRHVADQARKYQAKAKTLEQRIQSLEKQAK